MRRLKKPFLWSVFCAFAFFIGRLLILSGFKDEQMKKLNSPFILENIQASGLWNDRVFNIQVFQKQLQREDREYWLLWEYVCQSWGHNTITLFLPAQIMAQYSHAGSWWNEAKQILFQDVMAFLPRMTSTFQEVERPTVGWYRSFRVRGVSFLQPDANWITKMELVLPASKSKLNRNSKIPEHCRDKVYLKIICGPFSSFSPVLPRFSQEACVTS